MLDTYSRYLRLVRWAGARYRRQDGALVLSVGGAPSTYSRIESAAASKILGIKSGADAADTHQRRN